MTSKTRNEVDELVGIVTRIEATVLALVCGALGGLGLFVATVWLVVKGGDPVGPHLGLLGEYFYGYSVTWPGSLIGLAYGSMVGAIVGWLIGAIYNAVVWLRFRERRIQ